MVFQTNQGEMVNLYCVYRIEVDPNGNVYFYFTDQNKSVAVHKTGEYIQGKLLRNMIYRRMGIINEDVNVNYAKEKELYEESYIGWSLRRADKMEQR